MRAELIAALASAALAWATDTVDEEIIRSLDFFESLEMLEVDEMSVASPGAPGSPSSQDDLGNNGGEAHEEKN